MNTTYSHSQKLVLRDPEIIRKGVENILTLKNTIELRRHNCQSVSFVLSERKYEKLRLYNHRVTMIIEQN